MTLYGLNRTILQRCYEFPSRIYERVKGSFSGRFYLPHMLMYKQTHLLVPNLFIMADSSKSVIKLRKLKEKRLLWLDQKLDKDIRGYDHIVQYRDNHTAYLKSDWVDENIQIIIIKHNYEVNKVKTMKIKDFKKWEREEVDNEIQ